MKAFLTFVICLFLNINAHTQNVGIGTTAPNSSAVLDITATDKGVLLPRMDSTQRLAILNPKDGLILYDSTTFSFWFFRDTEWTEFHWEEVDNLGNHFATQDLDLDGQRIINLDDPTLPGDAATKLYVDYFINPLQSDVTDNTSDISINSSNISNNTTAINNHVSGDTDLSPTNELQTLSIAGQDLTISTGNTITLPTNTGIFENNAGVVRNTGSTSDDYVFGSTELPLNGVNTSDTLFFFDKSKAAFRFGTLDNSANWSTDSIGLSSLAFGLNPIAKGDGAISLGYLTQARGTLSLAQGSGTIANAQHSIAMGYQSQALGNSAIALGNSNIAKGNESFVVGLYSEANGVSSTAIGKFAISDAYSSMAIGRFNEGGGDSSIWVLTDPIFEVGIGQDAMNKKNALTIKKNGIISFKNYTFPNPDGNLDQILQTDGSGNLSWADQTPEVFENISGVVKSTGSNTDDFVFGATALPPNGTPISGTLFFFDDSKGAFRAGELDNSENWSPDSIGLRSVAFGQSTVASGLNSSAIGNKTLAIGNNSLAAGDRSVASGNNSFATGRLTTASGNYSAALGDNSVASGGRSTAMGDNTLASGSGSTAMGLSSVALGIGSTAMGNTTNATGNYSAALGDNTVASGGNSTSMGKNSTASGTNSTSMGDNTVASGMNSFAMGETNNAIGTSSTALGKSTEASGDYSTSLGHYTEASGWNSLAMGNGTQALSDNSIATGINSSASGNGAFANGFSTFATGDFSTAFGHYSGASGDYSIAAGISTDAKGEYSTAIGSYVIADAQNSFVIGRYNVGGGDNTNWISTDPLFEVGIGATFGNKKNALTIFKNGNAVFNEELTVGLTAGSIFNLGLNTFESISNSFLTLDASFLPSQDDMFNLGTPASRWDNIYATNGVIQTSDRRLKKNISNLTYGLESVLDMKPVQYNWNKEVDTDKQHLGLIAQDLLKLIPESVHQPEHKDEYLGVKYAVLVPVLIKAIQEQNELISDQVNTIQTIQDQMAELKEMMSALTNANVSIVDKEK